MEPYEDRIATVNAMYKGFVGAAERFYEATLGRDADDASIPLVEALSWAAALDWRIGAHWVPDGKPLHAAWPDRWTSHKPWTGEHDRMRQRPCRVCAD